MRVIQSVSRAEGDLEQEVNLPIIAIGQQQRCGGSLLLSLFDGHPEVYVHLPENYWGRPYKYHFPNAIRGLPSEQLWDHLHEPTMLGYSKSKAVHKGQDYVFDFDFHRSLFLEHVHEEFTKRQILFLYLSTYFRANASAVKPRLPKSFMYFAPRQALYAD